MSKTKISKFMQDTGIMTDIMVTLENAKKSLSLLEIRKIVDKADRRIMRELERGGYVKHLVHHAGNSAKQFRHPKTGKIENYKGTRFFKYELVKNK